MPFNPMDDAGEPLDAVLLLTDSDGNVTEIDPTEMVIHQPMNLDLASLARSIEGGQSAGTVQSSAGDAAITSMPERVIEFVRDRAGCISGARVSDREPPSYD